MSARRGSPGRSPAPAAGGRCGLRGPGVGSRLTLVTVLLAASLLSPGARDACAGCCSDGFPAVAAPLAAGVAPVHAGACCRAPVAQPGASCCGAADPPAAPACPHAVPADDGDDDPCGCRCGARDDAPATAPRADDARATVGADVATVTGGVATDGQDRRFARSDSSVPPPTRPLRVLLGVWRN